MKTFGEVVQIGDFFIQKPKEVQEEKKKKQTKTEFLAEWRAGKNSEKFFQRVINFSIWLVLEENHYS